ncbi:MAG: TerB family tellurite resistance protein [Pseudomonadales bacterium]
MSIGNLSKVKKFFGGLENSEEKNELYKEMLVMTLARATRADSVTDNEEIKKVQALVSSMLGEEVSEAEIRVAAGSELYETAPIQKYLSKVGPQIDPEQRRSIINALVEVFRADGKVSETEVDFFNMVSDSLRMTAAELAGLDK